MINVSTQSWDEVPSITLITDDHSQPILADSVDRSACHIISAQEAESFGVLPFRWDNGALCVAAFQPLTEATQNALKRFGQVRVFQTSHVDLALAQWDVYGSASQGRPRFGEIAVRSHRLKPATLKNALELQHRNGGVLGDLLVSLKAMTHWNVAEVLSEQTGIPSINLLEAGEEINANPRLSEAWGHLTQAEWRKYDMIPVWQTPDEIVVAVTNPFDGQGRAVLSAKSHKRVSAVITGRRDITTQLAEHYRDHDLKMSLTNLLDKNPDDSATTTVTRQQILVFCLLLALLIGVGIWRTNVSLAVVSSILVSAYAILVGHRLWIIHKGTQANHELSFTDEEVQQLTDDQLPVYTILIPARDEASVLPVLTAALQRLDYPKDRLDVKLLLEEDDVTTIAAARQANLPNFIEIVVVPVAEPRTKPKACNFGLQRARGEFVTIYDAEDLPEPTQLKKALLAFLHGSESLGCVQAKLSYFNAEQNLLTRWFTAEYAAWFDLLLPALHAAKMPIPLGGTSNHFRTTVLKELGSWDPYNVTEDADLGIRLHKAGYRTAVMNSTTYEEANSDFVNWVRQRSRWIKGYLQTWLVHMRHPRQLRKQLGRRGFWGFQLAILGTPLMFLLNPVYWFITSLWFMTHWGLIPQLFPPGIYYLGMLNLLVGNFTFTYLNAVGVAKRGDWNLVPYALLTPIYWAMMSLASWKALVQLITKPSHWEKTQHGLVDWTKIQANIHLGQQDAS